MPELIFKVIQTPLQGLSDSLGGGLDISLDELGEKVTQQERASIEAAVSDLEAANKTDSVDDIKAKIDALMKAMEPVSQRIYAEASKQQQEPPKGAGGAGSAGQASQESAKGDYVDADYKIVDD